MKKNLTLFILAVVLIFTSACGSAVAPPAATAAVETNEASVTEPTPAPTPALTPTPAPKPGQAEYETGLQLMSEDKAPDAIESFKASFNLGYAKAAEQLGTLYYNGYNKKPGDNSTWTNSYEDSSAWYGEAVALWQTQADAGDADAQYNLGRMYAYGYGVARDYEKSKELFALAAAQGHEGAQKRAVVYAAPVDEALTHEVNLLPVKEPYSEPQLSSICFLVFRLEEQLKVAIVKIDGPSYYLDETGNKVPAEADWGLRELFTGNRLVDFPDYAPKKGGRVNEILSCPMAVREGYSGLEMLKVIPSYEINDLYDYLDVNTPEGGMYDFLFGKDGRSGIKNIDQSPIIKFSSSTSTYELLRWIYIDLIPAEYRFAITMWTAMKAPEGAVILAGVSEESLAVLGVKNPDLVYSEDSEALVFVDTNGKRRIIYTFSVENGGEMEVFDRFTEKRLFVSGKEESKWYGVDIKNIRDEIPLLEGATMINYTNMIMIGNYGGNMDVEKSVYPMDANGGYTTGTILYTNADWARIYLLTTPENMQVTAAEILR